MPGELFQVASRLVLGTVPPLVFDETLGSGLHFEWKVEKTNTSAPDVAEITVFNIMAELRKAIAARTFLPGRMTVELSIGWFGLGPAPGAILEQLFVGEDWRVIAERKTGVDVLTIVEAGAGLSSIDAGPKGGAVFGTLIEEAVADLVKQLGLIPSPAALAKVAEKGAQLALPTKSFNATFEGDPRPQLNDLMASLRLSWGVDGGIFHVYDAGVRNDLPPSVLSPGSGLLRWEELDDGGVEFEALAQPRVVPGLQVQILDELGVVVGGGPTRVERVSFVGTSDGPSLMQGLARKLQIL